MSIEKQWRETELTEDARRLVYYWIRKKSISRAYWLALTLGIVESHRDYLWPWLRHDFEEWIRYLSLRAFFIPFVVSLFILLMLYIGVEPIHDIKLIGTINIITILTYIASWQRKSLPCFVIVFGGRLLIDLFLIPVRVNEYNDYLMHSLIFSFEPIEWDFNNREHVKAISLIGQMSDKLRDFQFTRPPPEAESQPPEAGSNPPTE